MLYSYFHLHHHRYVIIVIIIIIIIIIIYLFFNSYFSYIYFFFQLGATLQSLFSVPFCWPLCLGPGVVRLEVRGPTKHLYCLSLPVHVLW